MLTGTQTQNMYRVCILQCYYSLHPNFELNSDKKANIEKN